MIPHWGNFIHRTMGDNIISIRYNRRFATKPDLLNVITWNRKRKIEKMVENITESVVQNVTDNQNISRIVFC